MLSHADGWINHVHRDPHNSEEEAAEGEALKNEDIARECACRDCVDDRETGCIDLNTCRKSAANFILALKQKWRLKLEMINKDTEEYVFPSEEEEERMDIREGRTRRRQFRDRMEIKSLKKGFRVFADLTDLSDKLPKAQKKDSAPIQQGRANITVYTNSFCRNNGNLDAKAGAGVWFGQNDPRNIKARVPDFLLQSNNTVVVMDSSLEQMNP
jgi:hypothetical protein